MKLKTQRHNPTTQTNHLNQHLQSSKDPTLPQLSEIHNNWNQSNQSTKDINSNSTNHSNSIKPIQWSLFIIFPKCQNPPKPSNLIKLRTKPNHQERNASYTSFNPFPAIKLINNQPIQQNPQNHPKFEILKLS